MTRQKSFEFSSDFKIAIELMISFYNDRRSCSFTTFVVLIRGQNVS